MADRPRRRTTEKELISNSKNPFDLVTSSPSNNGCIVVDPSFGEKGGNVVNNDDDDGRTTGLILPATLSSAAVSTTPQSFPAVHTVEFPDVYWRDDDDDDHNKSTSYTQAWNSEGVDNSGVRKRVAPLKFHTETMESFPALRFDKTPTPPSDGKDMFLSPLLDAIMAAQQHGVERGREKECNNDDVCCKEDLLLSPEDDMHPPSAHGGVDRDGGGAGRFDGVGRERNFGVSRTTTTTTITASPKLSASKALTVDVDFGQVHTVECGGSVLRNGMEGAATAVISSDRNLISSGTKFMKQHNCQPPPHQTQSELQRRHQPQRFTNYELSTSGVRNGTQEKDDGEDDTVLRNLLIDLPREGHQQHEQDGLHPWTPIVVMEELGTGSSWMLLLLPYIALLVSVLLDFDSGLSTKSVVLSGSERCHGYLSSTDETLSSIQDSGASSVGRGCGFPISPIPRQPCVYEFIWDDDEATSICGIVGTSDDDGNDSTQSPSSSETTTVPRPSGVAFTSGPLEDVPALSSYMYGDVAFTNLSSDALALVADGHVAVSTVVYQRQRTDSDEGKEGSSEVIWTPVSSFDEYAPHNSHGQLSNLSLACNLRSAEYFATNVTLWDCRSPRLVDILFSLPGTDVLTGSPLRVEVFLHYVNTSYTNLASYKVVNGFSAGEQKVENMTNSSVGPQPEVSLVELIMRSNLNASRNPIDILVELASSGSFVIEYERTSYAFLVSIVRVMMLLATLSFLIFWTWSMGSQGVCGTIGAAGGSGKGGEFGQVLLGNSCCIRRWCCCFGSICGLPRLSRHGGDGIDEEYQLLNVKESVSARSSRRARYAWWECSWVLLPERRYLFFLLSFLLFLQNPVLAYMYYSPALCGSRRAHTVAGVVGGVGAHGILLCWLCLIHGLGYHTAALARRRADQQRKVLMQRRAAEYLAAFEAGAASGLSTKALDNVATTDPTSQAAAIARTISPSSYYDMYGDMDGSVSVAAASAVLRMTHDPCGPDWADFLIPKLFLFAVGVAAVVVTATSRFPHCGRIVGSNNVEAAAGAGDARSPCGDDWDHRNVYVIGSLVQFSVLVLWAMLIVRYAFLSGERLRREPFLSTRPAQLAFRVLVGILLLGCAAVFVPFLFDVLSLVRKWSGLSAVAVKERDGFSYDTTSENHAGKASSSLGFLLRFLIHATRQFPYVGTASTLGPGKIMYVTVCCISAAFIFLPSSSFYHKDDNGSSSSTVKDKSYTGMMGSESDRRAGHSGSDTCWQLRHFDMELNRHLSDKRMVVPLCRFAHTWRIFPLPVSLLPRRQLQLHVHPQREGVFVCQEDLRLYSHAMNPGEGRGEVIASVGRYTPVFCLEIACWLLECSWQAYYSATEYSVGDWAPGRISLETLGLNLEAAISDSKTETHVFVCSNSEAQVDGEADSVIVVAFRGSATATNLGVDLKMRQVCLPDAITGVRNRPAFTLAADREVTTNTPHEDIWDLTTTTYRSPAGSLSSSTRYDFGHPLCPSDQLQSREGLWDEDIKSEEPATVHNSPLPLFSSCLGVSKRILRNIPCARQALPCVHGGFLEAYSAIRRELIEKILNVMHRQLGKSVQKPKDLKLNKEQMKGDVGSAVTTPKIYITGHSLGGSLGQLLALDLASNCAISLPGHGVGMEDKERIPGVQQRRNSWTADSAEYDNDTTASAERTTTRRRRAKSEACESNASRSENCDNENSLFQIPIAVYTFGQPRVGNHAFAHLYKRRVPHTFRVCAEGDAFTGMPPPVGCCGGLYKHAGLEVALDEGCTGNTLVGPTVVETLFRFTKVRTSVAAHSMERYRDCLESALTPDELQEYYRRRHGGGEWMAGSRHLPGWVTQVKRSGMHSNNII